MKWRHPAAVVVPRYPGDSRGRLVSVESNDPESFWHLERYGQPQPRRHRPESFRFDEWQLNMMIKAVEDAVANEVWA